MNIINELLLLKRKQNTNAKHDLLERFQMDFIILKDRPF